MIWFLPVNQSRLRAGRFRVPPHGRTLKKLVPRALARWAPLFFGNTVFLPLPAGAWFQRICSAAFLQGMSFKENAQGQAKET